MAVLSDYTSGRISLANGSTTVTGTGTLFNVAKFREGDTLQIQNLTAVIASVNSDTSLTLTAPWTGTTLTNAVYRARYLPDGARVTAQATTLIELLGNGNLQSIAGLASAADKGVFFSGGGVADLFDLTAVARAFLKMSGVPAANKLPFFDAANGSDLTDLTAFARTVLATANGPAMWSAMGATMNTSANGAIRLPNGFIFQWGAFWTGSGSTLTFPQAFPNSCLAVVANKGQTAMTPNNIHDTWQFGMITRTGVEVAGRRISGGVVSIANVTATWMAYGW